MWFGSSPSCEKELPRRSRVFTEKEILQVLLPTLKKLHASKFGNVQGSVSTFADLSVALGATPSHVQRVYFWCLKSAYFLETQWGPPLVRGLWLPPRGCCVICDESGLSWQACFWSLHFVRCAFASCYVRKISILQLPSHKQHLRRES